MTRTRLGKRQKYIEEFKKGKLKVLINYDGITTNSMTQVLMSYCKAYHESCTVR